MILTLEEINEIRARNGMELMTKEEYELPFDEWHMITFGYGPDVFMTDGSMVDYKTTGKEH